MKRKPLPPVEFLKESLIYEPESGRLAWNTRPLHHFISHKGWRTWNARFAGKEAGAKNFRPNGDKRYIEIGLASGKTSGSRTFNSVYIIHAIMGVEVPSDCQIDHEDHDEWNNKWSNLRISTPQENIFNRVCTKKDGLPKGVFRNGSGFSSKVGINKTVHYLGTFRTPHEAHAAYCEMAKKLHGEFACFDHKDQ